jgi:hypothetical protein
MVLAILPEHFPIHALTAHCRFELYDSLGASSQHLFYTMMREYVASLVPNGALGAYSLLRFLRFVPIEWG